MNVKKIDRALVLAALLCLSMGLNSTLTSCQADQTLALEKQPPSRPGLLILAHGSPDKTWNGSINQLTERVKQVNARENTFHAVQTAFMEFAQPDAATGIEQLQKAGCDRIIVVPFFIAPSSHSHFDVPAVLGLYSSPSIRQTLEQEGARVAKPSVPLTFTQTLSEGDLLAQYALEEVRSLSQNPKEEALVLIVHGDPDHAAMIERMMRQVATYCCGQSGIDDADWASCEVGQSFWSQAAPTIKRAAERKPRVLVVGLYASLTAQKIAQWAAKTMPRDGAHGEAGVPLDGANIVYSSKSVVQYPPTAERIVQMASQALR